MSTNAFRNTEYKDLDETWRCHQAARIVQRHIQFGQHGRLDLDALLAGVARTIRLANPGKAVRQVRQSDIDAFAAQIRGGALGPANDITRASRP